MKWEPAGKGGGAKPRDKKRGGCLAIVAAIVIIAIVGGIVSSCGGGEEPERLDWPTTGLAAMLPEPSVDTGSVAINSEDSFSADVEGYARSDYEGYAAQCQERGFTVDASEGGDSFEAYNAEGYHLRLSFYGSMEEMDIRLDAPVDRARRADSGAALHNGAHWRRQLLAAQCFHWQHERRAVLCLRGCVLCRRLQRGLRPW